MEYFCLEINTINTINNTSSTALLFDFEASHLVRSKRNCEIVETESLNIGVTVTAAYRSVRICPGRSGPAPR